MSAGLFERRLSAITTVLAAAVSFSANAQLVFCNDGPDAVTSAIGLLQPSGELATAGWITVYERECRTIIAKQLDLESVYVHVVRTHTGEQLEAIPHSTNYHMLCTNQTSFRITDARSCPPDPQSGVAFRSFHRIETAGEPGIMLTFKWVEHTGLQAELEAIHNTTANVLPAGTESPGRAASLPIDKVLGRLRKQVEALIPDFDESGEWQSVGDGVMVRYRVWRDPLQLYAIGPQTVLGSVRLYYSAEGGIRKPWGTHTDVTTVGSCGTADPRIVDVSFRSVVMLAHDARTVSMNTSITNVKLVNRCQPTFLKIDVSSRLRARIMPEVAALAKHIDEEIMYMDQDAPRAQP